MIITITKYLTKKEDILMSKKNKFATAFLALLAFTPMYCLAGEGPSQELYWLNNIWMMVATFLVFIMHFGLCYA